MRFEWDENKNRANIRKHGFDLADAEQVFAGPMVIALDDRQDYGEERWIGIGMLQARTVVVVYVERAAETIRVISMRKALSYERKVYEQTITNGLATD
jgi:hypothetical protein